MVGLLTGTLIGFCIGMLVARLGIPSFVVTLALFLALQGVVLTIIGEKGSIDSGEFIAKLNSDNIPVWLGWVIAVALVGELRGADVREQQAPPSQRPDERADSRCGH